MPNDNNSEEEIETPEDVRKRVKEEQLERDEEDEAEFHPHMGKIMDINGFTHISSLSWDKSYDNPTGTSTVELHYPIEDTKDINKYIYKGVSCKAKIRRSTDQEFKPSYIEEYGLDEDGMKQREHYPTKEQIEEIAIENALAELVTSNEETTSAELAEETLPKTRSDSDAGIYGFVTDVSYKQKGTELEIKDWGYALEDKTKELSFNNMPRSQIMTEVIKSYGLVPVVDFTGLRDDNISWSNVVNKGGSSNAQSTTDLKQSSEWDDSTTSHDLSGYDTRTVDYAGTIPPEDPKYYESIADPNANYSKFVEGCTTPEQVMTKLRPKAKYCSYSDNRDANAKISFDNMTVPGLNCGDSARLVKCCMDYCGIPCIVIHVGHVATAPYGHYYNAVKKGGKWYTTDLCRVNNTIKNRTMTQTLGV